MSTWLSRVLTSAIGSIAVGGVVSVGVAAWCLARVEDGRAPSTGALHVREGRFWEVATDEALGLRWVNIERLQTPSSNPSLEVLGIPNWAEPRGRGPVGEWRVGTLAVGWPWLMIARQWSEVDPDLLFVPHVEVDDDGFTIAKMATNFMRRSRSAVDGGTYSLLFGGIAANIALFGGVTFLVFLRRVFTPRASAARQPE